MFRAGQRPHKWLGKLLEFLEAGLKGTYVSVEPFHLFRYLSEQVFRFNERKDDDQGRFLTMARNLCLPKLTYAELIGEK